MSTYGEGKNGNGILTKTEELRSFARKVHTRALTDFIPIPGVDADEQARRIREEPEDDDLTNCVYWENESGSHGWCKKYTGKVVQWG